MTGFLIVLTLPIWSLEKSVDTRLSVPPIKHLHVLSDPYVIRDSVLIKISNPFLTNKLPVGDKTMYFPVPYDPYQPIPSGRSAPHNCYFPSLVAVSIILAQTNSFPSHSTPKN